MTKHPHTTRLTTERLNAFTDATLAIVVTLLVLDIHVPPKALKQGAFLEFWQDLEHDVLVYAASFWLVGIYWLVHHTIVGYARYVSQRLLFTNLWFLFVITLLPFLTKLKNTFPEDAMTAQIFGVGHLGCGLALLALWHHVTSHADLQAQPVTSRAKRRLFGGISVGCVMSVAATSAAHIDARLCSYLLPTIPLAYAALLVHHHVRGETLPED